MPCTLRRSPLKMNSLPVALTIVLSVIVKYGNRPNAAIWSTNSLCTESAMLVWNSRAQSTRRFRATDNRISARAICHDLPPPRPPWNTLYRAGSNKPLNFGGKTISTACIPKPHLQRKPCLSGFAELGRVQPPRPTLRFLANLQCLRGNLRQLGRIEIRIGQRPLDVLFVRVPFVAMAVHDLRAAARFRIQRLGLFLGGATCNHPCNFLRYLAVQQWLNVLRPAFFLNPLLNRRARDAMPTRTLRLVAPRFIFRADALPVDCSCHGRHPEKSSQNSPAGCNGSSDRMMVRPFTLSGDKLVESEATAQSTHIRPRSACPCASATETKSAHSTCLLIRRPV